MKRGLKYVLEWVQSIVIVIFMVRVTVITSDPRDEAVVKLMAVGRTARLG